MTNVFGLNSTPGLHRVFNLWRKTQKLEAVLPLPLENLQIGSEKYSTKSLGAQSICMEAQNCQGK